MIRVLNGKVGRSRTVNIDPGGIVMLNAWIEVRTSLGLTGIYPLICTVDREDGALPRSHRAVTVVGAMREREW